MLLHIVMHACGLSDAFLFWGLQMGHSIKVLSWAGWLQVVRSSKCVPKSLLTHFQNVSCLCRIETDQQVDDSFPQRTGSERPQPTPTIPEHAESRLTALNVGALSIAVDAVMLTLLVTALAVSTESGTCIIAAIPEFCTYLKGALSHGTSRAKRVFVPAVLPPPPCPGYIMCPGCTLPSCKRRILNGNIDLMANAAYIGEKVSRMYYVLKRAIRK